MQILAVQHPLPGLWAGRRQGPVRGRKPPRPPCRESALLGPGLVRGSRGGGRGPSRSRRRSGRAAAAPATSRCRRLLSPRRISHFLHLFLLEGEGEDGCWGCRRFSEQGLLTLTLPTPRLRTSVGVGGSGACVRGPVRMFFLEGASILFSKGSMIADHTNPCVCVGNRVHAGLLGAGVPGWKPGAGRASHTATLI